MSEADVLSGAAVAAGIASLVGAALGSYFSKKFQNLADKEDIGGITSKVEEIRHEFESRREELRHLNQTRFVAVEERLKKHQEAFTHALELIQCVHKPNCAKKVAEIQKWLKNNALYLTPVARNALIDANHSAAHHKTVIAANQGVQNGSASVKANWKIIMDAPEILQKETDLPNFNHTPSATNSLIDIGEENIGSDN